MGMLGPSSFQDHFALLTDPRGSNARHQLSDILVIAVCAVICGAEGWEDIEEYGKAQATWFDYMSNTPSDVFLEIATQQYFLLLSGRWFRSDSLEASEVEDNHDYNDGQIILSYS